ncbi:unnamed protein product [Clonostachys rhizophaga]|uniref:Condensin complex subunit 2 n=1 Tax=Clonostachys rhizophaga TaxID=160324 RepID=A0A9N9VMS1_9HYPO|nr:unnamed protein product [Clonostachys rhizophaga]
MPRVAQVPRASSVRATSGSAPSPYKSPIKIPLNDDAQERGKRVNSRKALQEKQINEIRAAATPRKASARLDDLENGTPGPGTPRGARAGTFMDDGDDPVAVGTTPMKRVPILANFEEWMKMATDNKINAANSWNFALIDYFHDMSLLKEGDSVNFQKASCTLDGCVKIYTNRVDSVATETGKLLSGLADSGSKKKDREEDGEESEEELDEDGNVKKKPKKKSQRSSEATLAPSFSSIQLKKLELEFAVDPLFKKASADFDEGGAKGLLLNHLMIDSQGRIVFDSSDDSVDEAAIGKKQDDQHEEVLDEGADDTEMGNTTKELGQEVEVPELDEDDDEAAVEIDLVSLRQRFFPELSRLDELDVCPSLKNFDIGDPSGSTDIPFLKALDDWRQDNISEGPEGAIAYGDNSGMVLDGEAPGFDEDDDGGLGAFDMGANVAFGEGGDAWAREAALEPQMRVFNAGGEGVDGETDGYTDKGEYVVSMTDPRKTEKAHEDILSFFDQALKKNWTSAEHWRIRKIKDSSKPTEAKKRKEKEPFQIDFDAPTDSAMHELLYTQAANNAAISIPKSQWKSKGRHLLPDDKHFHSRSLLSLFLKPKARIGQRKVGFGGRGIATTVADSLQPGEMDEAFWARQNDPLDNHDDTVAPQGDYDANFFQDDGLPFAGVDDDDDLEFADAREQFTPDLNGDVGITEGVGITAMLGGEMTSAITGAFGTTLVTQTRRIRPEYVQYARVAKKVDVRRLKEEIWRGMAFDDLETPPTPADDEPLPGMGDPSLKFTSVMNGLKTAYPPKMMNDISTSFCFISLLHLANEKGLVIEKTEDLEELNIRKDWTAEATEE